MRILLERLARKCQVWSSLTLISCSEVFDILNESFCGFWHKNGQWKWNPHFIDMTSDQNFDCAIVYGMSTLVGSIPFLFLSGSKQIPSTRRRLWRKWQSWNLCTLLTTSICGFNDQFFWVFGCMFMFGLSWVPKCVLFWNTSSESFLGPLFVVNSGFLNVDPTFSVLISKLTRLHFLWFQCLNDRNNVVSYNSFEMLN